LAGPLRALATLLPESAGVSCHQAQLVCSQLTPKELDAVQAFVRAGQQCINRLSQNTVDNLKRLLSATLPGLQKAPPLGADSVSSIYELFDSFDHDGNGVLTRSEFSEACRALLSKSLSDDEITALMNNSDANSSGDIDIHEFCVWLYGEKKSAAKTSGADMESTLPIGMQVRIEGLKGAAHLNGQLAVVCEINESAGRYIVELESSGEKKALKLQNLVAIGKAPSRAASASFKFNHAGQWQKSVELPKITRDSAPGRHPRGESSSRKEPSPPMPEPDLRAGAFTVGDRVRVGGLNGAIDLNGQLAVVFGLDKTSGRYLVEFENGAGQKKLRLENLTPMGVATGPIAAKARMFASMNQ